MALPPGHVICGWRVVMGARIMLRLFEIAPVAVDAAATLSTASSLWPAASVVSLLFVSCVVGAVIAGSGVPAVSAGGSGTVMVGLLFRCAVMVGGRRSLVMSIAKVL